MFSLNEMVCWRLCFCFGFDRKGKCDVTILDRDYSRTATPSDVRFLRSRELS